MRSTDTPTLLDSSETAFHVLYGVCIISFIVNSVLSVLTVVDLPLHSLCFTCLLMATWLAVAYLLLLSLCFTFPTYGRVCYLYRQWYMYMISVPCLHFTFITCLIPFFLLHIMYALRYPTHIAPISCSLPKTYTWYGAFNSTTDSKYNYCSHNLHAILQMTVTYSDGVAMHLCMSRENTSCMYIHTVCIAILHLAT